MNEHSVCTGCRRVFNLDDLRLDERKNVYTVETYFDAKPNSVFADFCSVECLKNVEAGTLGLEKWDFKTMRPPKKFFVIDEDEKETLEKAQEERA